MNQTIVATFWFNSSSGPARYETLVYADGSTSCSCKGWTFRRVTPDGKRSCRHTRIVEAGRGAQMADVSRLEPEYLSVIAPPTRSTPPTKASPMPAPGSRKMIIE